MENELKRCPFCGGEALIIKRKKNGLFAPTCKNLDCFAWNCDDPNCTSCSDGYARRDNAVEAWNTRATDYRRSKCYI